MMKRHRHSSVPQTARPMGQPAAGRRRNIPPGKLMSVRLNKTQIDKASKDKSGKFSDNFNVTLFLVRPNDQTLQAEFSRTNLPCQAPEPPVDSSEESSEEEAELRARPGPPQPQARVQSTVVRTLTAPLPGPVTHGMVRNSTEPGSRMAVSMAVTSQSTWI